MNSAAGWGAQWEAGHSGLRGEKRRNAVLKFMRQLAPLQEDNLDRRAGDA